MLTAAINRVLSQSRNNDLVTCEVIAGADFRDFSPEPLFNLSFPSTRDGQWKTQTRRAKRCTRLAFLSDRAETVLYLLRNSSLPSLLKKYRRLVDIYLQDHPQFIFFDGLMLPCCPMFAFNCCWLAALALFLSALLFRHKMSD